MDMPPLRRSIYYIYTLSDSMRENGRTDIKTRHRKGDGNLTCWIEGESWVLISSLWSSWTSSEKEKKPKLLLKRGNRLWTKQLLSRRSVEGRTATFSEIVMWWCEKISYFISFRWCDGPNCIPGPRLLPYQQGTHLGVSKLIPRHIYNAIGKCYPGWGDCDTWERQLLGFGITKPREACRKQIPKTFFEWIPSTNSSPRRLIWSSGSHSRASHHIISSGGLGS